MEKMKAKIQCPICKKEHEAVLHNRIDISQEPQMKDKLMKEDIFGFQCPDCGFYSDLHYDVLYADPEAKLFLYMADAERPAGAGADMEPEAKQAAQDAVTDSAVQQAAESSWTALRNRASAAAGTCFDGGKVSPDAILRIVFSPADLREKVRIFDHGLDDRIVEIFKGFSLSQFDYSENYYVTDIRYDLIDGKEFFKVRVSDGTEQYVLDFNGGYEQILNEYIEKIPPLRSAVPVCVDLDYAAAIVRAVAQQ